MKSAKPLNVRSAKKTQTNTQTKQNKNKLKFFLILTPPPNGEGGLNSIKITNIRQMIEHQKKLRQKLVKVKNKRYSRAPAYNPSRYIIC